MADEKEAGSLPLSTSHIYDSLETEQRGMRSPNQTFYELSGKEMRRSELPLHGRIGREVLQQLLSEPRRIGRLAMPLRP